LKFAALWFCLTPLLAQNVITTIAGTDWLFPGDGKPAVNAPLSGTSGLSLTVDRSGNYYVGDADNYMAMRVGPDGIVHVIAGNGAGFISGDGGLGVNAGLGLPSAITVDSADNIYIAVFDNRVRKLSPDGIITTFAGTGEDGFGGDGGPATKALLSDSHGLAVDTAGNVYISDTSNNRIRKITPDGIITTFAGNGQQGISGNNLPATSVPLNQPTRIALDSAGNVYIVESGPNPAQGDRIRKVDANGIITTVAGGGTDFTTNIPAASAAMLPLAVGVDAARNLYIVDQFRQGILKVDSTGQLTTVAGGSEIAGFAGDGGPAINALFAFNLYPDVAVDSSGNIFIADDGNLRIRKIDTAKTIQTIAGNGLFQFSGNGGPATSASLDYPVGVIEDNAGNIFVSDQQANRIRRIARDGTISVFAGNGMEAEMGDHGPATAASLLLPSYMTFAPDGSLLVADLCVIRSIDKTGIIHTVAGGGDCNYGGDGGSPLQASLNLPEGMAFDSGGNLVIADTYNNRLRVILAPPDGRIFTLAGDGRAAFSGDNGSSLKAELNEPVGVRIYNGDVYFSDYLNHRIRRIDGQTFIITTVAGNGTPGFAGDGGPATQAEINLPEGITFDQAGNLYIADTGNGRVRKVDPTGIITTFAGSNSNRFGDGGPATKAGIAAPADVWVNPSGSVLITDSPTNRVRAVLSTPPSFQVSINNLAFTATAGSSPVSQSINVAGSIPGIPYTVATAASGPWFQVSPIAAAMPASVTITVDPSMLFPGTYPATVVIRAPNAQPSQQVVHVTLTVTAAGQPSLSVKPSSLTYSFLQQSPAATRGLNVSNAGGGSLTFNAVSNAPWLKAAPSSGTLGAFASTPVTITADPTGRPPGTYSGTITFSSVNPAQSVVVPVTMTISAVQQTILIPQSGLTFYAVQGSGALPPQFFSILNTGVGQMPFTAQASTLSGGPWLSAFPATGVSDAASPIVPQVRLDASPGNLAAGVYYGTVQVTAPGADNNPQFVSVVLNVLPPGSKLGPLVQPSGMIFTSVVGAESPSSQTVTLQSTDNTPITFTSGFATPNGENWLTPLPASGTISQAQPASVVLQPQTGGLAPGVHRGTVTFSFSDGSTRTTSIVLVIIPSGPSLPAPGVKRPEAQGVCVPTTLAPVFTQLSSGFTVSAGFPGQVAVGVVDDCGNPMTTGSVNISFSNGDAPIRLVSLKDGNWTSTWTPEHSVSPITVTADAAIPDQNLSGEVKVVGGLSGSTTLTVGAGGVLNGASFSPQAPLAPGSLITIFGSQLAQGQTSASASPLPVTLGGSTVRLAGQQAPLAFAGAGQLNAIVPYGIAVNTTQQLIVSHGTSISVPQTITMAAAAPGIFTRDGSGQGQGLIEGVDSTGAQTTADASNPVTAGQSIVIYCTGLGEVTPAVPAGTAASLTTVSNTVNPVTLTIGGVPATVSFAGLAPGSVGTYQVNATVPQGVAPGNQVPVVITAAGQQSQAVTIAIK
jgi:uncharacterized protein (TIGR03437 family)